MKAMIIRRTLFFIPIAIISSLIIFSLIHLAPGDPIDMLAGTGHPPSPELMQKLRKDMGLDKPIYQQYLIWASKILRGDLGYSYSGRMMGRPVITIISSRIVPTLELMLVSQFLSIIIAIFLGVTAAVKQYSVFDNIASFLGLFLYSMPSFWISLMLILVLGLSLGLFPIFGATTAGTNLTGLAYWSDHIHHLILPLTAVSAMQIAYLFRLVRSSMLEVLNKEYVTTARVKGCRENIVVYKHALRNALIPVVTFVGMSMGFVLSGAVVVETVFSWPGMGKLAVEFALGRDYPALMSLSMIIVVLVYFFNLITDIAYIIINPQIRYN
jgi:peptide/nickel transport system permease protein